MRNYFQGKVARNDIPGRPLELYMCSVLKRQGYGEGFRWLAQYIDWTCPISVKTLHFSSNLLLSLFPISNSFGIRASMPHWCFRLYANKGRHDISHASKDKKKKTSRESTILWQKCNRSDGSVTIELAMNLRPIWGFTY